MVTKQTTFVAGAKCSAIIFLLNKNLFCNFAGYFLAGLVLKIQCFFGVCHILVSKSSQFQGIQENSQLCGLCLVYRAG